MKKILSLVLALLMSASAASFVGAAEEAAIAPEDTAVTATAVSDTEAEVRAQFADALSLLTNWGIFHGKGADDLAAADLIQRYEMALFVSRVSTGWTDDSKWAVAEQWYDRDHDTSGFDDLEGTPAINFLGALSYASQKGIILGYGNKKFGPSDGITYQDALTMIVRTLGYYNLSWPWGNIEKAVTLGLTKGIPASVKYTDVLNRGQVAQILYNALTATTKDGDTLAARNFNGAFDWQTIIITVAGKRVNDGAPKGYFTTEDDKALGIPEAKIFATQNMIGFKVVNADGTLSDKTYWVKNEQAFNFQDRLENYLGYAYKALFTKDADSNLVTMEMCKEIQEETVKNWGVTDGNYPIYNYLKDLNLRSKFSFSGNTYLNEWNGNYGWSEFIMMNALQGKDTTKAIGNKYGIDWINGHIVERVAKKEDGDPEYTVKDLDGNEIYFKRSWSWNETLNAYFHYIYKDVDGKKEVIGIDILDQADIDAMMKDLQVYETVKAGKGSRGLNILSNLDATKTAYATLIPFTLLNGTKPNYGIFEEYRLGQYTDAKIKCPDDDNAEKDGFKLLNLNAVSEAAAKLFTKDYNSYGKDFDTGDFMNLYNKDWAKKTAYEGIFETSCKHGFYWINEERGLPVTDKQYVLYSVDQGTGEIKVMKIIYDIKDEKHDDKNFINTGVVRAYNIEKKSVVIGDQTYYFDYPNLAGNGLTLDSSKLEQRAEFTYLFKSLFNQYVNYVILDGKLVYIELAGASSDLIIVDSYAGLSSDNYIVVNGYDTKDLVYRQYRIGSYNGWVKGDYYYYPTQADVDAAFERGTLYKINSYNADDDVYYVSTFANLNTARNPFALYDMDELVAKGVVDNSKTKIQLQSGYKKIGSDDWKKAGSKDKYVLICNPINTANPYTQNNGVEGDVPHTLSGIPVAYGNIYGDYAPIIVYVGVGGDGATWVAEGNKVKGVDATVLLNVDFASIYGFNRDQYDISYVLFLTYDYEVAAYNGAAADGWYLLGASTATAQCFNFYTGKVAPYAATNKDLKRGYAYPVINGVIVNDDNHYDAYALNTAIPAAYQSGSKYVFGHGLVGAYRDKDGELILWNKEEVSKQILTPAIDSSAKVLAATGQPVKDLTGGTSVFLVHTTDELDRRPNTTTGEWGVHKLITEVEKITLDQFKALVANYSASSVYFWYVHTMGGNTVFYIEDFGSYTVKDDVNFDAKNAVVVETAKIATGVDKDTALVKASATGKELLHNDVVIGLSVKDLTFKFADNGQDAHGFKLSGEDHNALYVDSFEFGDFLACNANDYNCAVSYDGDFANYRRIVNIAPTAYDPHKEEGGCDLIQTLKFVLPEAKTIKFPTLASPINAAGKYYADTVINVNFQDTDAKTKLHDEIYNFNVVFTVACEFNANGTIKSTDIKLNFTDFSNQLVGDNAAIALQAQ